jgi:hypothetical protein
MMDDWEEGAGESMYFGSLGESEGGMLDRGRLDRAEQLLNRGCGDGEKKVEDEVKGVQQATAWKSTKGPKSASNMSRFGRLMEVKRAVYPTDKDGWRVSPERATPKRA